MKLTLSRGVMLLSASWMLATLVSCNSQRLSCSKFYTYRSSTVNIKAITSKIKKQGVEVADIGVGEINIDPKYVIASNKLQELDLLQYSLCGQIKGLPKKDSLRNASVRQYINTLQDMLRVAQRPDSANTSSKEIINKLDAQASTQNKILDYLTGGNNYLKVVMQDTFINSTDTIDDTWKITGYIMNSGTTPIQNATVIVAQRFRDSNRKDSVLFRGRNLSFNNNPAPMHPLATEIDYNNGASFYQSVTTHLDTALYFIAEIIQPNIKITEKIFFRKINLGPRGFFWSHATSFYNHNTKEETYEIDPDFPRLKDGSVDWSTSPLD